MALLLSPTVHSWPSLIWLNLTDFWHDFLLFLTSQISPQHFPATWLATPSLVHPKTLVLGSVLGLYQCSPEVTCTPFGGKKGHEMSPLQTGCFLAHLLLSSHQQWHQALAGKFKGCNPLCPLPIPTLSWPSLWTWRECHYHRLASSALSLKDNVLN